MLLNTTYSNEEHDAIIHEMVGRPFSLLKKIEMSGTGSGRMVIDEVSPKLERTLRNGSDLNYGTIELRPSGVLVRITRRLDNFTWIIPYYQLAVFKSNGLSIHAQGEFVHFRQDRFLEGNKDFLKKMQQMKLLNTKDHYL